MSGFEGLRRVFRIGMVGGDVDREIQRELDFHLEETVAELMSRGMDEHTAREEANRRFGDLRSYRRELRRLDRKRETRDRAAGGLRAAAECVAEAGRGVRRGPGLAVAVVVLMALGLGVNGTMFTLLDRVFLSPPPHVQDAGSVRRLVMTFRSHRTGRQMTQAELTYPDYRDFGRVRGFSRVAAYAPQTLTLGHGEGAERVHAVLATSSFFPVLGVHPSLGRFYGPDDDAFGAPLVAVLGENLWRTRFAGDPTVLGREIDVGEGRYRVVGVAPRGFTGVDLERVDVWLPFMPAGELENGGQSWVDTRQWYWFEAIGRLAPGVAQPVASSQATAALRAGSSAQPGRANLAARLEPLEYGRSSDASGEVKLAPWLMGVALIVLLIACANVANLFLARGLRHRRETAVRLAMGVSRARLSTVLVLESVFLALLGGVAALLLTVWGGDVVRVLLLPDLAWRPTQLDPRLLLFIAAFALAAGIAAGLFPALQATRPALMQSLKAGGRGTAGHRSRLRSGLLVAQAALSVVLLVGTGLFVHSLSAARGVDLGFDPERVLLVRLQPEGGYPGGEAMTELYRRALDRLSGLGGVQDAAIATTVPFQNARGVDIRRPGEDSLPDDLGAMYINAVTPGFFQTIGMDLVRGRAFTKVDDSPSGRRVAVVSEVMAHRLWPGADPIGRCFYIEKEASCTTVVGVVRDSHRFGLVEPEDGKYYVPLSQAPYSWPPRAVLLRTGPAPETLSGPVQRELRAALPDLRLSTARPFRDVIDPKYRAWSMGASLFAVFGLLALAVACVGLYSLLSFAVAERTAELGIRSALGAGRVRIVRGVLGDGVRLAGFGITLGLVLAVLGGHWVRDLLFRTSPFDPVVMSVVAAAMLAVAAAAAGLPAWRASRVDPAEALRAE
jgi:putative ABC transport system permease protein